MDRELTKYMINNKYSFTFQELAQHKTDKKYLEKFSDYHMIMHWYMLENDIKLSYENHVLYHAMADIHNLLDELATNLLFEDDDYFDDDN